jgi:hypothetical protein
MARRRLAVEDRPVVVQVKLSLHPTGDADLIEFFARVPARLRAATVMAALRSGGMKVAVANLPSDEEIETALDGLLG